MANTAAIRVLVTIFGAAALIGMLCHAGLMLWSQNEFSGPESVVSAQSLMLARNGTLYYDLNQYPYTVCAYMPLFYFIEATLTLTRLPAWTAGRLLSFTSVLGIGWVLWRLIHLKTGQRRVAWIGLFLFASTALILSWGTTGQVDMLAVFWSLLAFYSYSRGYLWWAGACVVLALMTKQTALACPIVIFVLLLHRRPRLGLQFGGVVAGAVLLIALGINTALHGRFFDNVVFANINPFSPQKLELHLQYFAGATGPLFLIALMGLRRPREEQLYAGFALMLWLITAAKIGSDLNYQIESTVLVILCACTALHDLRFISMLSGHSRSWVTMLQIPLALYLAVNLRITANTLLGRFATERAFREQVETLRPYTGSGRLLCTDYNAMARLRGEIGVEALIYTLLVQAGRIDPEPLRRDLEAQSFATVVLYNRPGAEISSFTEPQLREIQTRYRLVAHVPGPYLDGVYVYQP